MSSNKEKDKEKEININKESVPPSMQTTDAPWYDAQPTASEYYRYQNEPFRQISREGEAEIYPDYYEKYDARRGKNIISGGKTGVCAHGHCPKSASQYFVNTRMRSVHLFSMSHLRAFAKTASSGSKPLILRAK